MLINTILDDAIAELVFDEIIECIFDEDHTILVTLCNRKSEDIKKLPDSLDSVVSVYLIEG
ncbi:hypothetical protein AYY23_08140 [Photobacterium kishitanii]|nr:hypothetical protein AYY23_08140 [Photobacterium kishitanii]